jgi:hypothetical protein
MSREPSPTGPRGGEQPGRIDPAQEAQLRDWAKKLDATPEQIKEAVQAVGDRADEVEAHLKGTRATSNSERVGEALRKSGAPPSDRSA